MTPSPLALALPASLLAAAAPVLAAAVPASPVAAAAATAAAAPPTRFLDIDGGRIAYDVAGERGPQVLCLPSMGDLRAEYRFLVPQLVAAGFRVATVDVRGMGESSTGFADVSAAAVGSDIVALLRRAGLLAPGESAFVVGTSLAAAAAVWAAAEAPDLVAGIVLVGPIIRDVPVSVFARAMFHVLLTPPWGKAAWGSYYPSLYPGHKPADFAAYRKALAANLAEKGRFASFRRMAFTSKAPCDARVPEVRARVLVVMGSRDPDFSDAAAEARLVAERLHGELVLVEGAGHYPHAEVPDEVGPRIAAFLRAAAGLEQR